VTPPHGPHYDAAPTKRPDVITARIFFTHDFDGTLWGYGATPEAAEAKTEQEIDRLYAGEEWPDEDGLTRQGWLDRLIRSKVEVCSATRLGVATTVAGLLGTEGDKAIRGAATVCEWV